VYGRTLLVDHQERPPMDTPHTLSGLAADVAAVRQELSLIRALMTGLAADVAALRAALEQPGGPGLRLARAEPAQAVLPFTPASPAEQLVTLDQMAAIVHLKKRSLERYRPQLPPPAVLGRRGRPTRWRWADVRGWLEQTFGQRLPEDFPYLAG
jgi:hypothetical protein